MKQIGHNSKIGCVLNVDMKPEVPWDRSVYGHTLTNYGSIWNLDGRYFDGVNDYIDCGNNASLDITNAVTIKTNINPNNVTGIKQVVFKTNSFYYGLTDNHIRYGRWGITAQTDNSSIIPNSYNHISITYNRIAWLTYLNNVQISKFTDTGNIPININNLEIGRQAGSSEHFKGFIKNTCVYNQALFGTKCGVIK